jgi:hypothetical protein
MNMKNKTKKKGIGRGLAIVALLLNVIVWPGLGTLIARKFNKGSMQMILSFVGFALAYVMTAALLIVFVVWVWALVSGIKIVIESRR